MNDVAHSWMNLTWSVMEASQRQIHTKPAPVLHADHSHISTLDYCSKDVVVQIWDVQGAAALHSHAARP